MPFHNLLGDELSGNGSTKPAASMRNNTTSSATASTGTKSSVRFICLPCAMAGVDKNSLLQVPPPRSLLKRRLLDMRAFPHSISHSCRRSEVAKHTWESPSCNGVVLGDVHACARCCGMLYSKCLAYCSSLPAHDYDTRSAPGLDCSSALSPLYLHGIMPVRSPIRSVDQRMWVFSD